MPITSIPVGKVVAFVFPDTAGTRCYVIGFVFSVWLDFGEMVRMIWEALWMDAGLTGTMRESVIILGKQIIVRTRVAT